MLLGHRLWLSGQGVAGHHPPMAELDWALSQLATWLSWGWPCPEKGAVPELGALG